MVTMVTWYSGSLSQLPVGKMSWGEKTKCSDQFPCSGQFHQTHWSHGHHGHQVHRQPISASSGQNELGEKSKKKPNVLTNFYLLV